MAEDREFDNVKLNDEQADARLEELEGWSREGGAIERSLEFDDFMEAIEFIGQLAPHAEELDHHPEIFNVYNEVDIKLTTHDAGGLTALDFELARRIDELVG